MDAETPLRPGLYVVATPIGNLGDLSPRARTVLERAHTIAAEDTRVTAHLGLNLNARRVPLTEHNVEHQIPSLLEICKEHVVALTSDAGTPAVADPGARLVAAAHSVEVPVFAIPGPSALAAALSVSGFQLGEARFLGFLSHKPGARRSELRRHAGSGAVLVVFEAPTRLGATLQDISEVLDDPEVCVCRELTKRFEETVRGRARDLSSRFAGTRGECVIVVQAPAAEAGLFDEQEVRTYLAEMMRAGARRAAAAGEAAHRFHIPRSAAYELWPEQGG